MQTNVSNVTFISLGAHFLISQPSFTPDSFICKIFLHLFKVQVSKFIFALAQDRESENGSTTGTPSRRTRTQRRGPAGLNLTTHQKYGDSFKKARPFHQRFFKIV